MLKATRFDAADFLDTEKKQAAYITAALETGDADFVRDALGIVAKARGMGHVAKTADLNGESLCKALGEIGKPEFSTVMRVMRTLGLTLAARPAQTKRTPKKRRAECRSRPPRRCRGSGSPRSRRLIGCASGSKRRAQRTTGRLFGLFWPLTIAQPHTRLALVLGDELRAEEPSS